MNLIFIHKHKIRFHECDPAGILFYGNFFKICHDAYEDFISLADQELNLFSLQKYLIPIVHCEADYKIPVKFNETIQISLSVVEISTHTFTILYTITNFDNNINAILKSIHILVKKNSLTKNSLTKDRLTIQPFKRWR